jgi:hypothetical protein
MKCYGNEAYMRYKLLFLHSTFSEVSDWPIKQSHNQNEGVAVRTHKPAVVLRRLT